MAQKSPTLSDLSEKGILFYENECIRGTWSVRELRRQISTNLHIRVGLSEDKLRTIEQQKRFFLEQHSSEQKEK